MIAYGMLYAVAVGVPILLAAHLGASYLRRHGRPERAIWMLSLAAASALPLLLLSRPAALVPFLPPAAVLPPAAIPASWPPFLEMGVIELPAVADEATPTRAAPSARMSIPLDDVLIGLWVLLSVLLAVRWAISAVGLARQSRSWRTNTLDGVRVLVTPSLGPAVFGLARPRIVVPSWAVALPPLQRALVLFHEQEHIRARDHWLVGLGRIGRVLVPWNPVVWIATGSLRRALELDCDRRVLRRRPDVEAYGATLLTVSELSSRRLVLGAAFAESEVPLRRRILAMTTPARPLTALGFVVTLALGAALLSGALAVPVPAVRAPQATQPQAVLPEPRVTVDPSARLIPLIDRTSGRELVMLRARAGRWYPLDGSPSRGVIVVPDRPGGAWGLLPPPGVNASNWDAIVEAWGAAVPALSELRIRELSVLPRILNPDDIVGAIADAYPLRLRDGGLGATVGMHFLVGATGVVQQTRIGQISAYRDLDEAALRVAEVYQFSPADLDGEPIPVWVSHAIDFRVP
jgi:TonB family protein